MSTHISASFSYVALEEMLEIVPKKQKLYIGIPRETKFQENRVALTPDAVSLLVSHGNRVVIEHLAGEHAFYSDQDYSEAGAEISMDKNAVFEADMIIKSGPITVDEIALCKMKQIIFSPVHLPFMEKKMIEALIKKKIIAIAFDSIKDHSGTYPILRAMSEIAGNSAILNAAKYLSNVHEGKGVLLGGISGIPPAKVLILGAGIVAEFAARTALGLGASVKIYDNYIYRLNRIQNNIGRRLYTSVIDPKELAQEIANADVVVGALKPINGVTPMVVTEQMVMSMKSGSVIVDVSIDRGGCIETSRPTTLHQPTFIKHDVIHYCVPNIASGVSRTASRAISNVLCPIVLDCGNSGGIEQVIANKPGIRNGVYLYKGCVTSKAIARRLDMKYTDIDLLLTNLI